MPLPLAALALGGFIKGGGLQGIVGSGARKREEQAAEVEKRERLYDYENFDYNQDVGPINNPYAQLAAQQQEYQTSQIDRASANQLAAQQQGGNFGAAQAVIGAQADAAQRAAQGVNQIRSQGAQFVENQRQKRISDRYSQSETLLSAASQRLDLARKARQKATNSIYKGLGGAFTAAAGGASAGAGATTAQQLQASGLTPTFSQDFTQTANAAAPVDKPKQDTTLVDGNQVLDTSTVGFNSGQFNLLQGF